GITDPGYSSGKRANGRVNDSAEHCADSYQSNMKSSDTMATTPFQRAITNLNKNPSKPLPRTTYTIFHFHRHIPRKATIPTTAANQLNGSFLGSRICIPNHTARFITTPTTAAAIPESAVARCTLPRSCSMCGPPRKTQRKQGTNVVHVLMKAPSVATASGGGPPDTIQPPISTTNCCTIINGHGFFSASYI